MVKTITAEMGEKCRIDVDKLHEILLQLPGEKYLDLYHLMQFRVTGYTPLGCYVPSSGCSV